MAKNNSADGHKHGVIRDRSSVTAASVKRDTSTGQFVVQSGDSRPRKGVRREILFPTEPTTIDREKIDRAIDLVISRRK